MTLPFQARRRALQVVVAVAGLVPVGGGLAGVLLGTRLTGDGGSINLDSHVRYLSGLLLAIGLGFWSTVPRIEQRGGRFALLTALVVAGGLGRLLGVAREGLPSGAMLFGLGMELGGDAVAVHVAVAPVAGAPMMGGAAAGPTRQDLPGCGGGWAMAAGLQGAGVEDAGVAWRMRGLAWRMRGLAWRVRGLAWSMQWSRRIGSICHDRRTCRRDVGTA